MNPQAATESEIPPEALRHLEAGLALSQAGDSAAAVARFGDAVRLAPAWSMAHFVLGSEYAACSDFVSAETSFALAALLTPSFHIARYQLGLLQFTGGRREIAMLTWGPLRGLGPQEPYPYLVEAFIAIMSNDAARATDMLAAALPLAGNAGLEADIRKLMASLTAQPEPQLPGALAPHASSSSEEAAPAHVLLANYSGGTVH